MLVSKHPLEAAKAECLTMARENPGAIFCFIRWGMEGSPSLKKQLEDAGLRTTLLEDVLRAGIGGKTDEC
jgi:hypothetical protein